MCTCGVCTYTLACTYLSVLWCACGDQRTTFWESILSYLVWSRVSRFCCWAAYSRPDDLELLRLCLPSLCRTAGITCPTFWHGFQVPELVQQVLLPSEFSPWPLVDSFCLFFYFSHLLIWQGVGTVHVMVHKWKLTVWVLRLELRLVGSVATVYTHWATLPHRFLRVFITTCSVPMEMTHKTCSSNICQWGKNGARKGMDL